MEDVQSFLLEREAENNLSLGLLASGGSAYVVRRHGVRCVLAHAGRRASLSLAPTATAEDLRQLGELLPDTVVSITGPAPWTRELAQQLARRLGRVAELKDCMRLYRLTRVDPPGVPGELVALGEQDESWLVGWMLEFFREALPFERLQPEEVAASCRSKLLQGDFFAWRAEGRLVSAAALTRPTPRGVCLSSVFTPQELRGRGYASAVSAALSQHALDGGKLFCVLYADRDNAISNAVYQKIGYRAIAEHEVYHLERAVP